MSLQYLGLDGIVERIKHACQLVSGNLKFAQVTDPPWQKQTEKSFTDLPCLQYLIVWISLLISKQTNCPAYIGFLFKVLGETAGAVPAFVSK